MKASGELTTRWALTLGYVLFAVFVVWVGFGCWDVAVAQPAGSPALSEVVLFGLRSVNDLEAQTHVYLSGFDRP